MSRFSDGKFSAIPVDPTNITGVSRAESRLIMTISRRSLSFNRSAAYTIQSPAYAKFMLDKESKILAVVGSDKDDVDAVPFARKKDGNKVFAIRVSYPQLVGLVCKLCGIPEGDVSYYRVVGEFDDDDQALFFNLNEVKKTDLKVRGPHLPQNEE